MTKQKTRHAKPHHSGVTMEFQAPQDLLTARPAIKIVKNVALDVQTPLFTVGIFDNNTIKSNFKKIGIGQVEGLPM